MPCMSGRLTSKVTALQAIAWGRKSDQAYLCMLVGRNACCGWGIAHV